MFHKNLHDLQALNQSKLNGAWMRMDENLGPLQRIAFIGVIDEADQKLARSAIRLMVSEIYHRRSKCGERMISDHTCSQCVWHDYTPFSICTWHQKRVGDTGTCEHFTAESAPREVTT